MTRSFFKIGFLLIITLPGVMVAFAQNSELPVKLEQVLSASGDEQNKTDTKPSSTKEEKAKEDEVKPVIKAKTSKKTFKPSEEISEDRPVPFPVDI